MALEKKYITLVVPENFSGRLDTFLQGSLPEKLSLSRSKVKSFILSGNVGRGDKYVRDPSKKVKSMEKFWFLLPEIKVSKIEPQNIDLDIVFEDADVLVVNKSAGMVVHPGSGVSDQTLVNALLYHCGNKISTVGSCDRPGIVHRIDKLTSGVLVVAKTEKAYQGLIPQFADHSIFRRYIAITWGRIKKNLRDHKNSNLKYSYGEDQYSLCTNIGRHGSDRKKMAVLKVGGKTAISKFREKKHFSMKGISLASLIECELETGRTHQLRVHLSHIGNPIIGDPTYGKRHKVSINLNEEVKKMREFKRQALHASVLGFKHPVSKEFMVFKAEPPEDLKSLLEMLENL